VVLPHYSMDEALKELRWARENGACTIFMRAIEADKRLVDPYFYPLYEEASRLDMPLGIHASGATLEMYDFFADEPGFNKFKLTVVGAFHSIVMADLPSKFPDLRIGFIEVSAQWVPYAAHDLAKRLEGRGRTIDKQDVLRSNRLYVACQTDDDLPYVLKYAGEDNIIIGSDYGHNDTSSELEALRHLKESGEVEPRIVSKILDDNPRVLYSL